MSITRHCQHTACDTVSPHMQCFPLNATITHLVNILGRVLFTFQQNALKAVCINREGRLGLVVSCSTPSPDEFPLSIFNPLMNMHANVHLVPVKDDIIQRVQRGRGFGGFLRMWRVVCVERCSGRLRSPRCAQVVCEDFILPGDSKQRLTFDVVAITCE